MQKTYILKGVDCPTCAEKIVSGLNKLDEVNEASYHHPTEKLYLYFAEELGEAELPSLEAKIKGLVNRLEPNCSLIDPRFYKRDESAEAEKQKRELRDLIIALVLFVIGFALRLAYGSFDLFPSLKEGLPELGFGHAEAFLGRNLYGGIASLIIFAVAYILASKRVYRAAFKARGWQKLLSENSLMIIASIGAIILGEYPEAVAVMLFFAWGDYLEQRAVEKSRSSIEESLSFIPETALRIVDGQVEKVEPEELKVGDVVLIHPGAKIPTDGRVLEGRSTLDTQAISGESLPVPVGPGFEVLSGSINGGGLLKLEVTKIYADSTVAGMLALLDQAAARKSPTERFITRFAKVYTPTVVIIAFIIALICPQFSSYGYSVWIYRTLVFLVASCPCALVISVPLAYFAGLGAASAQGILVRGGAALEELAKANTLFLDKTGTLTEGNFAISKLIPAPRVSPDELIAAAAIAEYGSQHPLAEALRRSLRRLCVADGCTLCEIERRDDSVEQLALTPEIVHRIMHSIQADLLDAEEVHGRGVRATYRGVEYLVGNARLFQENEVEIIPTDSDNTVIYVAKDKKFLGAICLADLIKPNARGTVAALSHCDACRIESVIMLTGDKSEVAESVCRAIGIKRFQAELLPEDKLNAYESIKPATGSKVFIGDGINDAPVLMASDVGVAMGGIGQAAAIEAADVIIANDNLEKFHQVLHISKETKKIVRGNIAFALGVKILVLVAGAFGHVGIWAAVFSDVGVALLAIFNSLRILPKKKKNTGG